MRIGGRPWRGIEMGCAVALTVALVALLAPSLDAAGPELDEGTLVAYPELVGDGLVPGADFESFYGPGGPYLMAGAFEVFGASVTVERLVGLALRLVIVLSLFAWARRWGLAAAVLAGSMAVLALAPLALSALAILGAIAFGLVGVAALSAALATGRQAPAVLAGMAAGLAIAFRPDIAVAVLAAGIALGVRSPARVRIGAAAGFAATSLLTALWLAVVGPDDLSRLVGDLLDSRDGRRLALPGPLSADGAPLTAGALVCVATIAVGAARWRVDDEPDRPARMLALGLFALALLPSALQRADNAHVLPFACVALAGVGPLLAEALRWRRAGASLAAAAVALVVLTGVLSVLRASAPAIREEVLQGGDPGFDVEAGGRSYPIDDEGAARDLNTILAELSERAEPGDSVFTGPTDLSRTEYSDTFIYFLVPELEPASFYTELNPGTADAEDSGLAEDISGADWLILTDRFEGFDTATTSVPAGSTEPNVVVAEEFRPVARSGSYELLERRTG
jgi:hypothetical protein